MGMESLFIKEDGSADINKMASFLDTKEQVLSSIVKSSEDLLKLASSMDLVADFFEGDLKKTKLWFITDNFNFGGVSPLFLIIRGRCHKVYNFIDDAIADNHP
jgi:hypothetical protein